MLSVLSSLFSPLQPYSRFLPQIKKGFIYSRYYEGLPDEGLIPVKKYPGLFEAIRHHPHLKSLPIFKVEQGVTADELERVHTAEYVDDLLNLDMTPALQMSEIMLTYDILEFFLYGSQGTIYALEMALASGGTFMNLAGGYHHGFPDHSEGFCFVNDVAVAIEHVQAKQPVNVLVVDLDVHQGNGIVRYFQERKDVFVFNIYQEDNYPIKETGHLDIGLLSGTKGDVYLSQLARGFTEIKKRFKPGLVVYLAGADPYLDDRLGGFELTKEDLRLRDKLVRQYVDTLGVPCAVVLAGGYAYQLQDLIDIHIQTAEEMLLNKA